MAFLGSPVRGSSLARWVVAAAVFGSLAVPFRFRPYYTHEGDTAPRNGKIGVSSPTTSTDDAAIDLWMAAPFRAMGMMDEIAQSSINCGWTGERPPAWLGLAAVISELPT